MKNIIIVSAISSGVNYIDDCIDLGLHPVVLKLGYFIENDYFRDFFCKQYNHLEEKYSNVCDFIKEEKTYDQTLNKLKKYHPIIVIAGAEDGAELAIRLANDLNIK